MTTEDRIRAMRLGTFTGLCTLYGITIWSTCVHGEWAVVAASGKHQSGARREHLIDAMAVSVCGVLDRIHDAQPEGAAAVEDVVKDLYESERAKQ